MVPSAHAPRYPTTMAVMALPVTPDSTETVLAVKKAQGTRLGGPPYGLRREGKQMVEDPAEQATIAPIGELRARGFS